MFSPDVFSSIQKEQHKDFVREAENRRLARLARANRPTTNRWNWLTQLFARSSKPMVEIVTVARTVELPALTTQELRVWEDRQAMYKRIAQGNGMADAEAYSDCLRNSQQPC